MRDLINALRGSKHCGWCVHNKPYTRWDNFVDFGKPDWLRGLARLQMHLGTDYFVVWKLGEWWHDRRHT